MLKKRFWNLRNRNLLKKPIKLTCWNQFSKMARQMNCDIDILPLECSTDSSERHWTQFVFMFLYSIVQCYFLSLGVARWAARGSSLKMEMQCNREEAAYSCKTRPYFQHTQWSAPLIPLVETFAPDLWTVIGLMGVWRRGQQSSDWQLSGLNPEKRSDVENPGNLLLLNGKNPRDMHVSSGRKSKITFVKLALLFWYSWNKEQQPGGVKFQ